MGGRPLIASILSILCGAAGLGGVVYFVADQNWIFSAGSFGGLLVAVGLWKQWQWAWWVGFGILSALLYWMYQHQAALSIHHWFGAVVLWIYFLIVFREYN